MATEIVTDQKPTRQPKRRSIAIKQLARALNRDLASGAMSSAASRLPTGIAPLDKQFPAILTPGKLVVIAARPSMGKTALAQQIAEHVAETSGTRALIYSIEMTAEGLLRRAISRRTGISMEAMSSGSLTKAAALKVGEAAVALESLDLNIADDITDIATLVRDAEAEAAVAGKPLGLIVVDYLQLVQAQAENRNLEINKVTSELKALAKRLKLPVIAVSQLNRQVESHARKSKRPVMSDLRESGGIEQDADVILFIYRADYYAAPGTKKTGTAELIIAKQRDGKTGAVETQFNDDRVSFG